LSIKSGIKNQIATRNKVKIMALIKCLECGAQLSDMAKSCIKCGAPNPIEIERANARSYLFLLAPFSLGWLFASIYLIFKNWIIIKECSFERLSAKGPDVVIEWMSRVLGSLMTPIVQFFDVEDIELRIYCSGIFENNLIIASRIAFICFAITLIGAWLIEKEE
jgi:ribosomal protein L40E